MTPRSRSRPFLLSALALIALFAATYLVFERTYLGELIDERAFTGAVIRHTLLFRLAGILLGILPVLAVAAGVLTVAIVGVATRRFKQLVVAVAVAGIAFGLAEVLKHVLLTRAETGATISTTNTFPSGHTTTAAACAFAVFVVATPRYRRLAALIGATVTFLVGLATLVQQWHRPSDVIAGLVLVAACGCVGGAVLSWWRVPAATGPARPLTALWWVGGAAGLASLASFVMLGMSSGAHLQIAFLGGSSAILATAALLTAAGNRVFRHLS
ncbi:MAG: phosphatase PAP2 family protein [Microbacteriaceae bacterium]|nr:phosphatase PAP2 family protein [Microbacteriaceae bacterium]MCL2796168.1 phosphatase PAP2 family protein [Microbacteriaceae bacterium]